MSGLKVEGLKKSFGANEVLKGIDFTAESGEFVSLLGPSGCGKTTILRIISGLETPDEGAVLVDGTDITRLKPEKRNIGLVFQNYALFPSMNVAKNVGYGLKLRKTPADEMAERVHEALRLVKLEGYENRRIGQLSGGEQQRVALARALVIKPKILLLDEPLSALDRKIRAEMQYEIRSIQQEVGITAIFVTHDQEEALTMSDKVILMNRGAIEQQGSPFAIYNQPASVFASDFLGKANLLTGTLKQGEGGWTVEEGELSLPVLHRGGQSGDRVRLAARGERFRFCEEGEEGAGLFRLERKIFTGVTWKLMGTLGGQRLEIAALGPWAESLEEGQTVWVRIPPENICYYLESNG